ncbi:MAG: hypothetical protein WCT04_25600 [Planctomycetota bacterium]
MKGVNTQKKEVRKKATKTKMQLMSKKALLDDMEIASFSALKTDPEAQDRAIEYLGTVSPKKMESIIESIPGLARALIDMLSKSMDLERDIQVSSQHRYEVLARLAKTKKMTGKQILAAFKMLKELDDSATIWTTVRDTTGKVLGGLAVLAATVGIVILTKGSGGTPKRL